MRVLVTGGKGFLGCHLTRALVAKGHEVVDAAREDGDLEKAGDALRLFQRAKPQIVFHLAASVGGIGANQRNPALFWRENTLMGLNVLDAALAINVQRLVLVGTTCSYPAAPKTIPFIEAEIYDGYPEPTNAPYGIAKRSLVVGALAYRRQFGLDVAVAVPTNLYGPGDDFAPESSHVIPALIKKVVAAERGHAPRFEVWGSGKPTRDFLYVEDAADGIARMMTSDVGGEIINLGSGREVSIRQLVDEVVTVCRYTGGAVFDATKPDGQLRRALNCEKAKRLLNWKATTPLHSGLKKTVDWYTKELGK